MWLNWQTNNKFTQKRNSLSKNNTQKLASVLSMKSFYTEFKLWNFKTINLLKWITNVRCELLSLLGKYVKTIKYNTIINVECQRKST